MPKKESEPTWLKYCWDKGVKQPCLSKYELRPRGQRVTISGARTRTGGAKHEADQLRLSADEWVVLPSTEYEQLKQDLTAFEATLSQDPIEHDLALAKFYGERGLELMRIQMLDNALHKAVDRPDVHIAEELAGALERAGFTEAALQTWDAVPIMIDEHDLDVPDLLGNAMLNRGRILEGLQRPVEAQIAYATAGQLRVISERLRHQ